MKKTLSFEPAKGNCNYRNIVLIDKILYLDEDESYERGSITRIHLIGREILETYDSINTLEARINSETDG